MNKKLNLLAIIPLLGAGIILRKISQEASINKTLDKKKTFLFVLCSFGVLVLLVVAFTLVTPLLTNAKLLTNSEAVVLFLLSAGYLWNAFTFVALNKCWDKLQPVSITPDSPEWENYKKQLAKLEKIMNEIITECQAILSNDGYITPNKKIIGVILREFEEIRDWYLSTNKILLLSRDTWKLWSIRTIIDSANYDFDDMLFDKVRAFQKQCDMLDESMKDYRY